MKIVVVGLGKVGRALTQQLSADKHDIVVIDRNPTVVDDICNICDVRGVTGNGGCYEVQAEAFEGGADLLMRQRTAMRSTSWPAWLPKS